MARFAFLAAPVAVLARPSSRRPGRRRDPALCPTTHARGAGAAVARERGASHALEARLATERLKADMPIWKKARFEHGEE